MCFAGGGQTSGGTPVNMGISSQSGTGQFGPAPTATPAPEPKYVVPSIEPEKPKPPEAATVTPSGVDVEALGYKGGTVPALDKLSAAQQKRKRDQTLVDN